MCHSFTMPCIFCSYGSFWGVGHIIFPSGSAAYSHISPACWMGIKAIKTAFFEQNIEGSSWKSRQSEKNSWEISVCVHTRKGFLVWITTQNYSNFKPYTKTYVYGLVWENNHVWLLSNVEDINILVLSKIDSQCVAWLFVCPLHLEVNSNSYYDNVLCTWHYYFWIRSFPEMSSQKEKHFEQRQFSCFQAWTEHKKICLINYGSDLVTWNCSRGRKELLVTYIQIMT